jgi:predicted Zn-dependent protease
LKKLAVLFVALLSLAPGICQKPDAEARHREELKRDVELGKEYIAEIEKTLKLSDDKEKLERVQRIGAEIAAIAKVTAVQAGWGDSRLNPFEYTFKVVQDKDINAFSVPGGFIYVNSGLLENVESDDELAGVLAHEIAHAAHRHLVTLMRERSKVDMYTLPILLAAVLGKSRDAGSLVVTSQLVSTALTSGWSVKAELDADHTGFQYLLKSNYHPVALLTFMERLAFQERRHSPNFDYGIMRTHPPGQERADAILAMLKENNLPVARSVVTTSFRVTPREADGMTEFLFGKEPLFALKTVGQEEAGSLAAKLNTFFDSCPQLFSIRADGERILWNGKLLVAFTKADAASPEQAAADAEKSIKRALFRLGFRTGG